MDVKEEWLEAPVVPPPLLTKAGEGKRTVPPPLPDEPHDEAPARSAIPPPLPKPAQDDLLATARGLKLKKTRKTPK